MSKPILRNGPLTSVFCELRFEEPDGDTSSVVRLSDRLRTLGFTEYSTEDGLQIEVRPAGFQQVAVKRHRFDNRDGTATVKLDGTTFVYESTDYTGVNLFLSQWGPAATAVKEELGLTSRT